MRIEFDTGNSGELAAVAALISSLRGESPVVAAPNLGDYVAAPPAAVADAPAPVPAVPTPPAAVADVVAPPVPSITAPVAQSPGAVAGVETDADGLPWDKRIHSTPASKKKDGKWRGKRGLDDATRDAVTAELRQLMAAPSPVPQPRFAESAPSVPLPPTPDAPDASMAFGAPVATVAGDVAAVPPAPVAPVPVAPAPVPAPPPVASGEAVQPAPVAPAPAPAALDFAGLMRKVTALQTAGKLTVADTLANAQALGLTGVRDLMTRTDLIASFDARLPTLEG